MATDQRLRVHWFVELTATSEASVPITRFACQSTNRSLRHAR
jgi:hypothetical protein